MGSTPEIEFDEGRHEYRVGGTVIPSVTQILAPLNELLGIPKDVLEASAEFGKHVHAACDLFNKGVLDEQALDIPLRPYLAGWKQFLFDTKAVVVASEQRVYNKRLGYCGTLDNIIDFPRRHGSYRAVVDLKSGLVPRSVGAQTAAYERAHQLMNHDQDLRRCSARLHRRCLQLLGDGKYKIHALSEHDRDWNLFVSCVNVHNFLQKRIA